jgi:hypothetical protein
LTSIRHGSKKTPEEIAALLPSKGEGKGKGRPEMTYPLGPEGLLILEVKNDVAMHSSVPGGFAVGDVTARLKPKDYAEDGVVCYMQGLAAEYDVIGIAVSGNPKGNTSISTFRVRQGGRVEKLSDTKILPAQKYWELLNDLYATKQTPIEVRGIWRLVAQPSSGRDEVVRGRQTDACQCRARLHCRNPTSLATTETTTTTHYPRKQLPRRTGP